jgi:predicted ATPase
MIKSIEFTVDWRCFKIGDKIEFNPGINLLVGDQGSGKSSLIQEIVNHVNRRDIHSNLVHDTDLVHYYDFEKSNLRTKSYVDTLSDIKSRFVSHGEFNLNVVIGLASKEKDAVFLMDEPDTALSIRSISVLVKTFAQMALNGCQVIAAVHNPYIIQALSVVCDMESRQWVMPKEFITKQLIDK